MIINGWIISANIYISRRHHSKSFIDLLRTWDIGRWEVVSILGFVSLHEWDSLVVADVLIHRTNFFLIFQLKFPIDSAEEFHKDCWNRVCPVHDWDRSIWWSNYQTNYRLNSRRIAIYLWKSFDQWFALRMGWGIIHSFLLFTKNADPGKWKVEVQNWVKVCIRHEYSSELLPIERTSK